MSTLPAPSSGGVYPSGQPGSHRYSHHQGKFFAHWLTLRSRDESAVARALSAARVDMNPHQVDAALFALKSPVEAGVLLADEVGLGKTIEAGLVLAQHWAQRRRRLLLIVPATLRKQWTQELEEKFQLPSVILESKSFNAFRQLDVSNPFQIEDAIIVTSYEFAASKQKELAAVSWDLVVLDEAHKLRNLYKGKSASKRAVALNEALRGRRKVLLTATPFQNSLMELYGLVSFISDEFFGSQKAFQMQYASGRSSEARLNDLRHRLKPICHRTLRRQVQAEGGINFTKRFSITQDFTPSDEELELYDKVSAYLQDPSILAIKPTARHLVTLVVRKILASSTFAIADTLETIIGRLESNQALTAKQIEDFETVDELSDELDSDGMERQGDAPDSDALQAELFCRAQEIDRLRGYRDLAKQIQSNRKGDALLLVLGRALAMAEKLGGQRKAVIFTESRRTQEYLRVLLEEHGYAGRTVLLNGSNDDVDSRQLYADWLERHAGSALVSGSRTADMKAAVVEAFRDHRDVLITTEAGGEGINLQFCSLLVNYDLPWNPQRVEQRIGRIHRYGQKSDVVVVNFVNRKNRADQLVFELLEKKFKLFDGVFGASDDILGAIESGVDIEQRILRIYQNCRDAAQIESEFATLQAELDESIGRREESARRMLLEHFDEDVVRNLRSRRAGMLHKINQYESQFLHLIAAERPKARISDKLVKLEEGDYAVSWPPAEEANAGLLRPDKGLGERLCRQAKERPTLPGTLHFDYAAVDAQRADVRQWLGSRGQLRVALVTIQTAEEVLEELVCSALCSDGRVVPDETAARLMEIPARFVPRHRVAEDRALPAFEAAVERVLAEANKRNESWFLQESERLDRWGEDQRLLLQQSIDEFDLHVRDAKRTLRQLETLEQKAQLKREIKRIEQQRDDAMLDFFEGRKRIERSQDVMLERVENALRTQHTVQVLFDVEWTLEHPEP
ncbi:SNF2-related protein [Xanthomonas hortorum]|uniref:SNF2-related protein n=1 Tax=Xanthomonas hortorum TaxID=56454 RepID=UPI00159461A8|nr:SNF2-related protein [Xanthomonas hortorum]NHF66875.1 DEAD/DEAH box helicase [Xanthomonas hortorum]